MSDDGYFGRAMDMELERDELLDGVARLKEENARAQAVRFTAPPPYLDPRVPLELRVEICEQAAFQGDRAAGTALYNLRQQLRMESEEGQRQVAHVGPVVRPSPEGEEDRLDLLRQAAAEKDMIEANRLRNEYFAGLQPPPPPPSTEFTQRQLAAKAALAEAVAKSRRDLGGGPAPRRDGTFTQSAPNPGPVIGEDLSWQRGGDAA